MGWIDWLRLARPPRLRSRGPISAAIFSAAIALVVSTLDGNFAGRGGKLACADEPPPTAAGIPNIARSPEVRRDQVSQGGVREFSSREEVRRR